MQQQEQEDSAPVSDHGLAALASATNGNGNRNENGNGGLSSSIGGGGDSTIVAGTGSTSAAGGINEAGIPGIATNGVLSSTSAPLKPPIPAPETSAVRDEEPAPATADYLPSDDRKIAAAASASEAVAEADRPKKLVTVAASAGEETSAAADAPQEASSLEIPADAPHDAVTTSTAPAEVAPGHESDVRGLNGSGLASTDQRKEPEETHSTGLPQSSVSDVPTHPTSAPDVPAPASQTVSAPGTQNPNNESEEKSLGVSSLTRSDTTLATPSTTQPATEHETKVELPANAAAGEELESKPVEAVMDEVSKPSTEAVAAPTQPEAPADTKMEAEETPAAPANLPAADIAEGTGDAAGDQSVGAIEPPAKRQRTTPPSDAQLAGPEATEMTAGQIKFCQNAIKSLKGRPEAPPFLQPVDPVALGIPHYPTIIQTPMDLGTVDIKLALTAAAQKGGSKPTEKTKQATSWKLDPMQDVYRSVEDFEKDVRLVFKNCVVFNGPDHLLSKSAQSLEAVFDKQVKTMPSLQGGQTSSADGDISTDISVGGLARRPSEASASSRPKREIHPPAPKDLPWADRPQAAIGTGGKKKKSRGSMSAREAAHYDKVNRDQLKYINKVVDDMHKPPLSQYAWVFYEKPGMDLDFAAAYYDMIKEPISLKEIKERLTRGEYEDIDGPKEDVSLMINNCFTFNPPGSDVYVMGEKVKKAWEAKLEKLPRPPPLIEPDYTEDDEDEEDEEDEENDAKAQSIRDQIAALQTMLEGLEGSGKAAGVKALASAKASLAAVPAKKQNKRRASESGASAGKKTGGAKKAKAPAAAAAGSSGAGETKKAKAKKSEGVRKRDEDVRDVSYEQKEELAAKITQLPDDRLDGALKIIAEDKPPSANDDEEIELDIDDLSPATLYKLYKYVVRPKGKKQTTSKLSASDGRKRGTGGVKRKNLDESEEAARIARLQQQLQQFDNAETSPAPAPSKPAAGHDDLVASDSSSGEDESDSDSDY